MEYFSQKSERSWSTLLEIKPESIYSAWSNPTKVT